MNNLPEKLREVSDSYYDTITTGSSNTWDAPILMYAAADEIERLREQNEYLKANVEMLLTEARAVRGE